MKLNVAKMKIITKEIFNCPCSLFRKVDIQELSKNKEELSSLLTEVELILLLTSITGALCWKRVG